MGDDDARHASRLETQARDRPVPIHPIDVVPRRRARGVERRLSMRGMALVVGLGIALAGACSAEAAVLCVKKTGVVVVRDACKRHEQAMDLSQFGVAGPAGAAGAQGPSGPGVFVL